MNIIMLSKIGVGNSIKIDNKYVDTYDLCVYMQDIAYLTTQYMGIVYSLDKYEYIIVWHDLSTLYFIDKELKIDKITGTETYFMVLDIIKEISGKKVSLSYMNFNVEMKQMKIGKEFALNNKYVAIIYESGINSLKLNSKLLENKIESIKDSVVGIILNHFKHDISKMVLDENRYLLGVILKDDKMFNLKLSKERFTNIISLFK